MKTIILSQNKTALVDDKDYLWINKYKWTLSKHKNSDINYAVYYPKRNGKRRMFYLHRIISGAKRGDIIDHVDGNGLNNQRSNLRILSHRQNMLNRKDIRNKRPGVTKHRNKFWARIRFQGKHISLGLFETENEAIIAYELAAKKYYGDKAFLKSS